MLKRILVVLLLLLGLSAGGAWMALSPYQPANLPVEFTIQPNQGLSDIVEAGLEAKETDIEINWILIKLMRKWQT
jgi:hypothetical protein